MYFFLQNVKLSVGLTDLERGDMHAHMALFDDILKNVEVPFSSQFSGSFQACCAESFISVCEKCAFF